MANNNDPEFQLLMQFNADLCSAEMEYDAAVEAEARVNPEFAAVLAVAKVRHQAVLDGPRGPGERYVDLMGKADAEMRATLLAASPAVRAARQQYQKRLREADTRFTVGEQAIAQVKQPG